MARRRLFLKPYTAVIASGAKQSLPLSINYSEIASSPAAPRKDTARPVCGHVLSRNRPFVVSRWVWRISMAVFACGIIAPSLVHAHGMGGEELGPPIVTSGLLGLVCYWLVVLWPSAKEKVDPARRFGGQNSGAPRVKRKPRLRIIETHSQFHTDQNSGRRAIDA